MEDLHKQKGKDHIVKDPVCGMEVGKKGQPLIHGGKEFYFCCATCRWAFEQNPEEFTKSHDA
jgi:YHS domain-containing protein